MTGSWAVPFAVVLAWSVDAQASDVSRLVLVVGNNRPADVYQTPLRYADDDAMRYNESFEGLAEARVLLTRLDRESRRYENVYPSIAPPRLAQLRRAAIMLRSRAAQLRAQGRFVEFLFVFAGHGGLDNGQPYLALEDGRLYPSDLELLILDGNPANVVHVLIDACQSAGFVEGRGPLAGYRAPMASDLLPFGGLVARHPNAGFVVAASTGGGAFEWSRFGSGVASHLIRSALAGAADLAPPDGRVTYDELEAFLRTATQDILPSDYRQEIRVLPPRALPSAAIIELQRTVWTTEILVDRPGRYWVRDAEGRRIIDLRQGRGSVRLVLPPYSRRFVLVKRQELGEGCRMVEPRSGGRCQRVDRTYEIAPASHVATSQLPSSGATLAPRGVVEDSVFEQLFASPYEVGSVLNRPSAPVIVTPPAAPVRPERPPAPVFDRRELRDPYTPDEAAPMATDPEELPVTPRPWITPVSDPPRAPGRPASTTLSCYPAARSSSGLLRWSCWPASSH